VAAFRSPVCFMNFGLIPYRQPYCTLLYYSRIPTSDLSELGFKVLRMCCLLGDQCAGSLVTLFEYQRRILNGATFRTRAGPLQLRSSSGCQRYIPNASLMLRTSGCMGYILKVACRLNVLGVLPQSRPRCMVDQPTCDTVKVPITGTQSETLHDLRRGRTLRCHEKESESESERERERWRERERACTRESESEGESERERDRARGQRTRKKERESESERE